VLERSLPFYTPSVTPSLGRYPGLRRCGWLLNFTTYSPEEDSHPQAVWSGGRVNRPLAALAWRVGAPELTGAG
jgi:hypothetical protein